GRDDRTAPAARRHRGQAVLQAGARPGRPAPRRPAPHPADLPHRRGRPADRGVRRGLARLGPARPAPRTRRPARRPLLRPRPRGPGRRSARRRRPPGRPRPSRRDHHGEHPVTTAPLDPAADAPPGRRSAALTLMPQPGGYLEHTAPALPAGTDAPPARRLAVVNLMPQADVYLDYMAQVLPAGTDVRWLRVRNHPYRSSDQEILAATHHFYDGSLLEDCDALLLTGAAMDINPDFTAATYWDEVVETLRDADGRVGSIAGVCWGAQVVGKVFFDLEKEHFSAKISGVIEMTNIAPEHPLMRGLDDRYWLPQSRYAQMEPK